SVGVEGAGGIAVPSPERLDGVSGRAVGPLAVVEVAGISNVIEDWLILQGRVRELDAEVAQAITQAVVKHQDGPVSLVSTRRTPLNGGSDDLGHKTTA